MSGEETVFVRRHKARVAASRKANLERINKTAEAYEAKHGVSELQGQYSSTDPQHRERALKRLRDEQRTAEERQNQVKGQELPDVLRQRKKMKAGNASKLAAPSAKFQAFRVTQVTQGKLTLCYQRYRLAIAKRERGPAEPRSPSTTAGMSRNAFRGLAKEWKLLLHVYRRQKEDDEQEIDLSALYSEPRLD